MTPEQLEAEVLFHRYCYYVLAEPRLPDAEYDKIERAAREVCPPESPVHKLGSSLPWDYPDEIKQRAEQGKPQ